MCFYQTILPSKIEYSPEFGYKMTYCGQWMIENHPRSRITHNQPDSLFHVRAVTMNRAFATAALVFSERAILQTLPGVLQQSRAICAQLQVAFPMSAI